MVESAAADRMAHPSDRSVACEKHKVFHKMSKYRKINVVGSSRVSSVLCCHTSIVEVILSRPLPPNI